MATPYAQSADEVCFIDTYTWSHTTFTVVYCSRDARNELIARMERGTAPIGSRLLKLNFAQLRSLYPDNAGIKRLIDGWQHNLLHTRSRAMLAVGLAAVRT